MGHPENCSSPRLHVCCRHTAHESPSVRITLSSILNTSWETVPEQECVLLRAVEPGTKLQCPEFHFHGTLPTPQTTIPAVTTAPLSIRLKEVM